MQPMDDPTQNWDTKLHDSAVSGGIHHTTNITNIYGNDKQDESNQQPKMKAVQPAVFPVGQQPMMMGYAATSASTALVLSIIGVLCCSPLGIVSLIMAQQALTITSVSPGHPDHNSARASQIISWIAIVFLVLTVAYWAWILFMLDASAASEYSRD